MECLDDATRHNCMEDGTWDVPVDPAPCPYCLKPGSIADMDLGKFDICFDIIKTFDAKPTPSIDL